MEVKELLHQEKLRKLEDKETYKYLGILEATNKLKRNISQANEKTLKIKHN